MNTAIQRFNKKICEEYTIEVTCDQSHIIDRYEEGELEEEEKPYHDLGQQATTELARVQENYE